MKIEIFYDTEDEHSKIVCNGKMLSGIEFEKLSKLIASHRETAFSIRRSESEIETFLNT